jgi:hypothetical protein
VRAIGQLQLWSAGACVASLLLFSGCDTSHKHPDAAVRHDAEAEDAAPDASEPDAAPMDAMSLDATPMDGGGPPYRVRLQDETAAGARSTSQHFILYSTTGQATPVSQGKEKSQSYSVSPGIVGGK